MSKKTKSVMSPHCDWCKTNNERFIITASGHTFCLEQFLGSPPIKDCHTEWMQHNKRRTI